MTMRTRRGRTGLSALVVAALLATGSAAIASAGAAQAEPPRHAVDNHEEAKGDHDNDNSVLHDDPQPEPEPITVAVPQAATIVSEPDLLPCGGTILADGKGVNPDAAITRLVDANLAADAECEPFPYEIASIPNGLSFKKPSGYPLAQFFVDVTWIRTAKDLDEPSTVDFEAVPGGYNVPLGDCPDSVRDASGNVVGLSVGTDTSPEEFAALGIVDQDGAPSVWNPEDNGLTQFACVAESDPVFEPWAEGGARWLVHERLWLMGDVIFRG